MGLLASGEAGGGFRGRAAGPGAGFPLSHSTLPGLGPGLRATGVESVQPAWGAGDDKDMDWVGVVEAW